MAFAYLFRVEALSRTRLGYSDKLANTYRCYQLPIAHIAKVQLFSFLTQQFTIITRLLLHKYPTKEWAIGCFYLLFLLHLQVFNLNVSIIRWAIILILTVFNKREYFFRFMILKRYDLPSKDSVDGWQFDWDSWYTTSHLSKNTE